MSDVDEAAMARSVAKAAEEHGLIQDEGGRWAPPKKRSSHRRRGDGQPFRPRPRLTVPLDGEEFREVYGAGAFEVSNAGRVRRKHPERGWLAVGVSTGKAWVTYDDGSRALVPLKRLVAEAFVSPPPQPGAWIRFRDGDERNCRLDNLIIGSNSGGPPPAASREVFVEEPSPPRCFVSDRDRVVVEVGGRYLLADRQVVLDLEPNCLGRMRGRIRS